MLKGLNLVPFGPGPHISCNRLAAQVNAGLEEGDTVINHPSDEVEDGVRVASTPACSVKW